MDSGWIHESAFDKWSNIDAALRLGRRGLQGGSSLAQLLEEHCAVRNKARLPPYTTKEILRWADAHHARTRRWPTLSSGRIREAPGETWAAAHSALFRGTRGMPGGSSLAKLLTKYRGVRNIHDLPRLSIRQILSWADAHYRRTSTWPTPRSGRIPKTNGETWAGINYALHAGIRNLSGGTRLAVLLAKHRGKRHHLRLPRLTTAKYLRGPTLIFAEQENGQPSLQVTSATHRMKIGVPLIPRSLSAFAVSRADRPWPSFYQRIGTYATIDACPSCRSPKS